MQEWVGKQGRRVVIPFAETARGSLLNCALPVVTILSVASLSLYILSLTQRGQWLSIIYRV